MPFIHINKYQCTDCNEIMDSPLSHDCPNDPMKDPVKRAEYQALEAEFNRHFQAWEDWLDVHCPDANATASIDGYPGDVAHRGKCILVSEAETESGEAVYISETLNDPTWGDVMLRFEQSILKTGDFHHCFLEGLYHVGSSDGVTILEFSTGS